MRTKRITDKSINRSLVWSKDVGFGGCHAHFLPFVKPAAIFREEILISQDFTLWIPAWKISNRTWSVSMLHRSVSLLKGNLSSHALGFLTETSVVLPSAQNIGMTWELSGSLQENANTHCTELKRGNLNGAGESTWSLARRLWLKGMFLFLLVQVFPLVLILGGFTYAFR